MNVTWCPFCFAEMDAALAKCPQCGAEVADRLRLSYQDRLLHALGHPLSETRMAAIIALGLRGEVSAALPLADCALAFPVDLIQGLQIVQALAGLPAGTERSQALHRLCQHPGHAVSWAAGLVLDEKEPRQA